MARFTRHTLNMNFMGEPYVVGQAVNAHPGNRLLLPGKFGELLNVWAVFFDRRMTAHAKRLRRETRHLPLAGHAVTPAAFQPERDVRLITTGGLLRVNDDR